MSIVDDVVADLTAQSQQLDDLVAGLEPEVWTRLTPAQGWTIAHQIAHLLWTDRVAVVAATDSDAFAAQMAEAMTEPAGYVDRAAEEIAAQPQDRILAEWRSGRAQLADALRAVPEGTKIPWFGPPMSAASMATARMMETWAHGLDVADALGVTMESTDRIKGVVHIGVRTRDFAYLINGLAPPAQPFRYEITAPSGELWTWGPDDASNIVRGSAVDFCLLCTQRRNISDLGLEVIGDEAKRWSTIAQCFAGPPGSGREPLVNKEIRQ